MWLAELRLAEEVGMAGSNVRQRARLPKVRVEMGQALCVREQRAERALLDRPLPTIPTHTPDYEWVFLNDPLINMPKTLR